ncbi:unknown [Parabacteroides sp. CAG:2]|nr:unknown [Parabacteroides sp. CAG:2]
MIFFGYSLSVSILYIIDVFLYAFSLVMHLIVNFLLYNFVLCFFMISLVSR